MDRHSLHVYRLYGLRYALTVIKYFYRLQTPLPKHLDKGSPSIIDVYWSPIKGEVSCIKVGPWPPCKDYILSSRSGGLSRSPCLTVRVSCVDGIEPFVCLCQFYV